MGKQKKVWSPQQDSLLRRFYQSEQMRNWSLIAKKMFQQHGTPKKSGKQCRQRYQNHIDTSVTKIQWTRQQQVQLIRLHNQIGNKWANIALQLPGKTDNCVKNHFYSKLRKVLRKLNKIIHHYFRKEFREININVIYKLVEATEEMFKEYPNCSQEVSLKCREVQNKMLDVAIDNDDDEIDDQNEDIGIYKIIIAEIYAASKEYKRKSKKSRNLSIQAPNLKKNTEVKAKIIVVKSASKAPSDGYISDSEHGSMSQEQEQIQLSKQSPVINLNILSGKSLINQQQKSLTQKHIQIEQGKQGIQNMLRQNNILQNQFTTSNLTNNNLFKFSDRGSFKSYNNSDRESDKQFFNMFQSSDGEMNSRRKQSKYLYFAQRVDDNNPICFSEKQ